MSTSKTDPGRFFEDFRIGETISHATPRTVGEGERALYIALTGSRFALASSDEFARRLKLPGAPLDDMLVFHLVFGRSVPDISLNAIANLGYADGRFGAAVYPGDTLSAASRVIGLKENSNHETGMVYVRTTGINQRGETVLDYVRWVMLPKRDRSSPLGSGHAQPGQSKPSGWFMHLSVFAPLTGTRCSSRCSLSALRAPHPPAGW